MHTPNCQRLQTSHNGKNCVSCSIENRTRTTKIPANIGTMGKILFTCWRIAQVLNGLFINGSSRDIQQKDFGKRHHLFLFIWIASRMYWYPRAWKEDRSAFYPASQTIGTPEKTHFPEGDCARPKKSHSKKSKNLFILKYLLENSDFKIFKLVYICSVFLGTNFVIILRGEINCTSNKQQAFFYG